METVLDKCSFCKTRDMAPMPMRDGSHLTFMGCPYCDTDGGVDEKGNGISRPMPPGSKQYLGVGPNSDRP